MNGTLKGTRVWGWEEREEGGLMAAAPPHVTTAVPGPGSFHLAPHLD